MRKLEIYTYMYQVLTKKYPENKIFYEEYEGGDYYNTSKTHFYGEQKQFLETIDHGTYS